MRRVLFVTTVPSTIAAFLLPFSRYFRSQGWRVDAASQDITTSDRCVGEFDRLWDIEWSRNPLDYHNTVVVPKKIRALVEQEGYDLVHVHTPVAAFVTRCALRSLPKSVRPTVIYTAHGFHFYKGGHPLNNAVFLSLEKLAGRWTDYLVVINKEDEVSAKRHRIVPPERLVYMPGIGVDRGHYCPESVSEEQVKTVRSELGLTSEDQLILMVAEMIPRKRHCDAVQAFALQKSSTLHLAFAGGGPLETQLKQMAAELGISDRVHFLGHRSDVPTLMCASVATLLTSGQEGLARSVMESLCLGVPVIGADSRGIRDLLRDGAGYLVHKGDVEGFARAMQHVATHPEESKHAGILGRLQMKAYDVDVILEMHRELYSRALAERDSAL